MADVDAYAAGGWADEPAPPRADRDDSTTDVNLQNLPASLKPRPLPKGFEGATPMGKGGGTLSQLTNELHIACFKTDLQKVRSILAAGKPASNKFRVNAIDHESPPLIFAVRQAAMSEQQDRDIAEIAKLLIDAGADVNYLTPGEECPLILAAIYGGGTHGKVETCRVLLDAGANVRQRCKRHKYTALHWAIISGFSNVVEMLVSKGSSCTTKCGKEKETAQEHAARRKLNMKKAEGTMTGPRTREGRVEELEKIIAISRAGEAERLNHKSSKLEAKLEAKRERLAASVAAEGAEATGRPDDNAEDADAIAGSSMQSAVEIE